MRSLCAPLLCAALVFCGCGGASVERKRAIRVCIDRPFQHGRCVRSFDAARLLGLTLSAASKLAARNGYEVRSVAPLAANEVLTMDYSFNRLDVECSGISEDSVVVAYKGQG
jgi:hypothetical protein